MAWPANAETSDRTSVVASARTSSCTGTMTAISSTTIVAFFQRTSLVGLVPEESSDCSVTHPAWGRAASIGMLVVLVPRFTVGKAWSACEPAVAASKSTCEYASSMRVETSDRLISTIVLFPFG